MRPIRILLFTAAVSSALLLWSPSASCQPSVKSLSDTPVYMGMVSLNVSPYLPLPSFSAVPSISVHTSHGAFFSRSGVSTGVSAELPYTLIGVAALSSHTRYFYPSSGDGRSRGYVGAELGVGVGWDDGGYAFFNGAAEIGLTVNFQRVSLDLGLRAQFMPPAVSDGFFLPLKIGIIF